MLKIRLTRTGKKVQESFRFVLADHRKAVKKSFIEVLGHYIPYKNPKVLEINKERVEYWIKHGAQPTDTVASLLKKQGFANMDMYIKPKNKKRKNKKGGDEAAAPTA